VLGDCDEYALAMAVRLEWKERSGTIKISERAQYNQLLGRLGMTPADRSKVAAEPHDVAQELGVSRLSAAYPSGGRTTVQTCNLHGGRFENAPGSMGLPLVFAVA